jgi:bifunctional non-homologous end joining protein LigD
VIDGETVALDQDGLPRFEGLRSRRHRTFSVVFYAFDLFYREGYDLTACPLVKRKALLKRILLKTIPVAFALQYITGTGERLFEKLEALQLEGMMKRKDSVNAFSRHRDWLKVKTAAGRLTMQKRMETWGK